MQTTTHRRPAARTASVPRAASAQAASSSVPSVGASRAAKGLSLGALAGLALLAFSCAGSPSTPVAKPPVQPDSAKKPLPQTAEEKRIAALENVDSLLTSGKTEAAVAKIDELSQARPEDSELRLLKAAALASAGKIDEARAETARIVAAEPGNTKALVMAVNLARFAGDEKSRRDLLDKGSAASPSDPGLLAAWGQFYLDNDDWKRAELNFRKSLDGDAANPDAALGLGQALYKQARYADAAPAFDRAVALDPGSTWAYADRSKNRYQQGDYNGALADLDKAIALSPDASWIRLERGRMYLDARRMDEAVADFSEAIAAEPDYFLPYVYRAGIYEQTGKDEAALADYRRIIELEPDYWYAWESIGATTFRLGRWAEAADGFRRAYGNAKNNYAYAILAGLSYMRAGKPADAKAWAGSIAPSIDREKNAIWWLMLRLVQDQGDQATELEAKLQNEKSLDTKAAILFYLGEYWIARGKPNLGSKYLGLSQDMGRVECLEYRLLAPEQKRLATAGGNG